MSVLDHHSAVTCYCRFADIVVFRAHHKCIINIVFTALSLAHTMQTPMHTVVIILCAEKYENSFLQSQAHHPLCAAHGLCLNVMGYIFYYDFIFMPIIFIFI